MDKKDKRILMITPFAKSQRGNTVTVERLRTGLTKRGFLIDVLSLEEKDCLEILRSSLATKDYHLLHFFNAQHFARVLSQVPEISSVLILLTTTGTDINNPFNGSEGMQLEKAYQAAEKIVIFHPDFASNILSLDLGLSAKIIPIPQGVSLSASPESGLDFTPSPGEVVFVIPSGLRPIKNIEMTLDALAIIQAERSNLRLLIAGARIDEVYSQQIVNRVNHLSWAEYLGELPHKSMVELFSLSDVVINSSHSEGQPQGALEGMSCGLPCILSAVPGNLNLIQHGVEGFYAKNEQELAAAALYLINHEQERIVMGKAARDLVQAQFSLDKELQAYEDLYRNLIPLPKP